MRNALAFVVVVSMLACSLVTDPAVAGEPMRCYPARDLFPDAVKTLKGDVDGDRRLDRVMTRARWIDDLTCRGWLSVTTADGVLRKEVEGFTDVLIGPPGITGLVRLDRRPGLEVSLLTWHGASDGFVELYGMRGNRLMSLANWSFSYGGSVVYPTGVDCVRRRGAVLVQTDAEYVPDEGRYAVDRVFYRLEAGLLQPSFTERFLVRPSRLGRFLELVSFGPFPSCTVVEGRAW